MTPRTVFKHRNLLLSKMNHIHGPGEASTMEFEFEDKYERGLVRFDRSEREEIRNSLPLSFVKIMLFWIERSRRLRKARSQVAGLMESITKPFCQWCGTAWALSCESIGSVEETFNQFMRLPLERPGADPEEDSHWDVKRWQKHFLENTTFRTLCFRCRGRLFQTRTDKRGVQYDI